MGPLVPIFCFEKLKMTSGQFTLLVLISTITGIFGNNFWGKITDKIGTIPVITVGTFMWMAMSSFWCFVTPDTVWGLYIQWGIGGFFAVAYIAGTFNLVLNLVPLHCKVAGVSLHLAFTSLAAFTATILGGYLIEYFLETMHGGIEVYRIGFAIQIVSILFGLLLLKNIKEPSRSEGTSIPGAFRTLRQLVALQGSSYFVNLTLHRSKRS